MYHNFQTFEFKLNCIPEYLVIVLQSQRIFGEGKKGGNHKAAKSQSNKKQSTHITCADSAKRPSFCYSHNINTIRANLENTLAASLLFFLVETSIFTTNLSAIRVIINNKRINISKKV